jgi:uncharacterized membrane protein
MTKDLNWNQKTTIVAAILLCLLCVAWEWFLAPLRPHGSLMVLKAVPLALLLPGLIKGKNDSMQVASMVILLYFFEGFARLFEPGIQTYLALMEVLLCSVIFYAVLKHLGPIKKAAVAKKKALEEAQLLPNDSV